MLASIDILSVAQTLEAGMLICFGFAWPVDIYKTLKVRHTTGKSARFMGLVLLGYLCGIGGKVFRADGGLPEPVTWLYVLNAVLVGIDIALCLHYRMRGANK